MTDATPSSRASHISGLLAIASGIAGFVLLASHPEGDAHTFAEVLKSEAANRVVDAGVHGGFIVVLALQTVCYALLSARIGFGRLPALAGFVFFAFGATFLSASMLMDGLVVPALAAKYVAAPDKIDFARSLFAFAGTVISLVMPIGLGFYSAAIASWGAGLMASGIARIAGAVGLVIGGTSFAAIALTAGTLNPLVLMGAIAAAMAWAVVAGIVLLRG